MACNGMASYPFFTPNFILDNEEHQLPSHLTHILPSNQCSNLQELRGVAAMMGKRSMSFSRIEPSEEANIDDDLSDDCLQLGEKKRRLNVEQVRALEKNFEMGNKLDPDRKMQLAKALGLQPRQIAIWFQNRRARWKTKQLEKDYQLLKNKFEAVKIENDALKANNKKLHAEILALRGREATEQINLNKETEGSSSNRSENSSETIMDFSRTAAMESPLHRQQSIAFFPSLRPPSMAQLHHNHKSEFQYPKIEQSIAEENYSNLLCGTEDQPVFWPW